MLTAVGKACRLRPRIESIWMAFGKAGLAGAGRKLPLEKRRYDNRENDVDRVKSSLMDRMKDFEHPSELVLETTIQPPQTRSEDESSITIKGKEYIPQRLTAEEIEFKRHVMKKKGLVDILKKIRSQEDGPGLYTVLRAEEQEDVYNAINSVSFTKMAPQHILRGLVYCQKTRLVKVFNSNSLLQAILKVSTYLRKLSPQEVATFASFLNKAKLQDEVIHIL